ncbi:activator of basal transcription 1-like [Ischnura elegans]|uniref:activator of basal transcription 1-like n=1 Tax=Ischnura elegans TaxID=197161 RepID=UPI001ED8BABD|nr:activator of basal transcription 1-like [Ischnura elegans]
MVMGKVDGSDGENADVSSSSAVSKLKKRKPGIIYLSTIPKYMNVLKIREIFGMFGEVGRVFLQPSSPGKPGGKKMKNKQYSEGWVEFKRKKIAKEVAESLNNKPIGGRKKSKFYDNIWNIKYLPRFKWVHLSERLAYERAAHRQRLRLEISQARKEATHFALSVEKSQRLKRSKRKALEAGDSGHIVPYPQRKTESEIVGAKIDVRSGEEGEDRADLLKSWFGAT